MSNFYFDTEFHEYFVKYNGKMIPTIDLISIGIVDENNKKFYKICKDHNLEDSWSDVWLKENVFHQIYNELVPVSARDNLVFCFSTMVFLFKTYGITRKEIAEQILSFIGKDKTPEFYGYYSAYDHVSLCWLFGKMKNLPKHFPMLTIDLKQMMIERGLDSKWKETNCPDPESEHSALSDCLWNKKLYDEIIKSKK